MLDGSVDVLVCALALTHVPDLAPVFAEFVRVLRPGGHLVTSDSRGLIGDIGLPLAGGKTSTGAWRYMPAWTRLVSEYLSVALPLGLQVRSCTEPRRPSPLVNNDGSSATDGASGASASPRRAAVRLGAAQVRARRNQRRLGRATRGPDLALPDD